MAHLSRLLIAGAAVMGAGLFALNAPILTGPLVQHHDVKLVSGEVDLQDFITNTEANLATLQTESATSSTELTTALTNVSDHISTQISNAITGFDTGVNNALFGGFYGGDDGYVFGLFGGEPVAGPNGATETGSLINVLSNDFAHLSDPQGTEQLYSDINAYELEVLDHTAKPLLAPLLDETVRLSDGTRETIPSIPAELSQIQTNLINTFGTYNELKELAQTVLSPEISGFFALTTDLDNVSAAMAAGDSALATTDLNNLGSDVLNAIVNGYDAGTNPADGAENLFPGLISTGSFLNELYTTFTTQFITDLGTLAAGTTSTAASEVAGAAVPDLFGGLF